jgi:hypothetical protein
MGAESCSVHEESITLEKFILVQLLHGENLFLPPLLGYEEARDIFCFRLQFVYVFYTVTLVITSNIAFVIITSNHST